MANYMGGKCGSVYHVRLVSLFGFGHEVFLFLCFNFDILHASSCMIGCSGGLSWILTFSIR
ncbi:Ovule protein [Vibrio tubiashii]|uniref:Uncharacterized protein n=1 Tax=Vibrio tubiashii ATCC 19109 TaxID=1051646 RepID=F9T553_9VIBR|nr:hypothetical protein IX91_16690 [Vibrio tubiashii ATCC 19109]EGU55410.1 hypothetical protein VITU9109_14046 [Vibrio tubiashii ATCC 19109]EIF05068.1 hypothetical protein VT1337_04717 [Vibrio tubiashii NCIMB 1337 = ATCC 19106]